MVKPKKLIADLFRTPPAFDDRIGKVHRFDRNEKTTAFPEDHLKKILDSIHPDELIVIEPDVVMGHDSLSPGIMRIMREQLGQRNVYDPDQIVLVLDHVAPASTVGTANSQNLVRQFAQEPDY